MSTIKANPVREFARAKFMELLPSRQEMGNKAFRKAVWSAIQDQFGISVASACTQYNNVFKEVKLSHPQLVEGLGRSEDKKGGRKPIHLVDVIEKHTQSVVASGVSNNKARDMVKSAAHQELVIVPHAEPQELTAESDAEHDQGAEDDALLEQLGVELPDPVELPAAQDDAALM